MTPNDIVAVKNDAVEFIEFLLQMNEAQKHDTLTLLTGFKLGFEAASHNKSA